MKYLSTFSGIGGFEIGIKKAYELSQPLDRESVGALGHIGDSPNSDNSLRDGWRSRPVCVGYSEIDKYASSVYKYHNPGVRSYGDITKINTADLPDFDCLVGGFPCQAFSIAGKRKGFDDTRGTLFFDVARILSDKRPRHLVLENVKGLLSHDGGKTFTTILGVLTDLGYFVEWQVLNSKNFGVPQNRERIYIVGHFGGQCGRQVFPITDPHQPTSEYIQGHYSNTLTARYEAAQATGTYIGEGQLDAQKIRQLNNPTHSNDRVYAADGVSPTLNTAQGDNRQPFLHIPEATRKGYAEAGIGDAINLTASNSKTRRGRVSDIAPTVDTGMQLHTLTKDVRIRRLTPKECERLQGFPDDWTAISTEGSVSDTQRYKMCGNAVTTNVVHAVFEKLSQACGNL